MRRALFTPALLAAAAGLLACGPAADAPTDDAGETASSDAAAPTPGVTITSPAEGATLPAGPVTVELSVQGMDIVPAGDTTTGTGHHHLYLDEDLTPAGEPVPSVPGRIIHMGDGSASYTFENVGPGEHRIIAVVADGVHVPLRPWVVDTVFVTVQED